MRDLPLPVQRGEEKPGVLPDGQRTIAPIRRGDQPQPVVSLFLGNRSLLIRRLQPLAFGQQPDLVEVGRLGWRRVELAVA